MDNKSEVLVLTEFETKYRVDEKVLFPFKKLLDSLEEKSEFLYVESDDIYYVNGPSKDANKFIRLRFSNHKNVKQKFFTIKEKLNDKNNIQRIEVDLRIDPTDDYILRSDTFCKILGFTPNFRITKFCHIYDFKDATIVFYSVRDVDTQKLDHFIEIEVNEKLDFTESEAWDIIRKWEEILKPLGITASKRTRNSLFEMYRR